MDCNREEASRAKALAETKMRNNDFVGAQKLLMKANRLFSGLDNLPQMLAVCDVHISADSKINGLENWYGILQVMHFSDDATIKKQYRKLALLLHPDKNQFSGAEAAFKLVWEASRLLGDKEKRSQYDIKLRIYSRFASKQLNANSGPQCAAAANNASDSNINNVTFWTCCEHCGYRYKHMKKYVNTLLSCPNCRRPFKAFDIGFNGSSPGSSTGQKDAQNQGPRNTSFHKNAGSPGAKSGDTTVEVDEKATSREKLNKKNEGVDIKDTDVRKLKTEDDSSKNHAELSKSKKGEGTNNSEIRKADILKPKAEVTEPETVASKSALDESISKIDQAPSMSKDKNKRRNIVEDPIAGINVDVSDILKDKADSNDNNRRKAPRNSRQISNAEVNSGDSLSPPTKRSRSSVGIKSERTTKKTNLGDGSSKRLDSGNSSPPSCVYKGKAKKKVESAYQEISSTKDKGSGKCESSREGVVVAGKINNNQKANENPIAQDLPDPDFNNFELTTSCFAVNQVWSLYDPTDGMPRLYARIDKVLDSEFKLWITWIDPLQDTKDNSIPIVCGIFRDGDSDEVDDHLIFSCQMLHFPHNNNIIIYPRIGEIWAVFKGWDFSWGASSVNHKQPYEYDYVEVLSDFKDEVGIGVAYLGKVEGFVSLFSRNAQHGVLQLQIPPSEMLRFSHKVPSFKMTGKEREDVPPGCFELDTAALPKDMFEVDNGGLDREGSNGKTGSSFPEASKVDVQEDSTRKSSPSPKKRQKVHNSYGSKKSEKSIKAVDDLKLRKSPRFLRERNCQATSRSSQKTVEKKIANNGESCGQPTESCTFGEKMIMKTDSSRNAAMARDILKPRGNSKKRGRTDESLAQSSVNGLSTCLNPETHVPSSSTTGQENTFNFENQRSWDKFQIEQIWAIYSNDNGIPRKYAQIKKIDTEPEVKLHVALLELYPPPITHPVYCGRYKLKTGKAEVLAPSNFSHQVKAVKGKKNRFEIYPQKGEIWALYKNCNTTETEEVEIVEVVETDEESIQAVSLTAKVFNKLLLYGRNGQFVDISKTELSRFSYQIPAFRHDRRFGDGECWELDPKAVLDFNSKSL